MPTFPDGWDHLDDGLYGSVDHFMSDWHRNALAERYSRLEADNALDEAKIRCWLVSESYQDRQEGRAGGIPGCVPLPLWPGTRVHTAPE